ncbi:hypothetical protein HYH03_009875 [Edaphochlamys debaryana]|uniref:Uncharacterized protein n=1 Tax=Edaphochlamys debaryana TaxID=47281 RepID=A0A836BX68_9CHLO|nr:hypothetical protein HYH03_009875 [Edaphochlamys debaryana]|eukprot:KAG2491712.1 hypothetical protein HYH03_009875 [Edaphochlamys debaryana]
MLSRLQQPLRATARAAAVAPQRMFVLPTARPVAVVSYSKRDEVVSNWDALRQEPNAWYDNRTRKTNPRAPDFVRKDDRQTAIWIDSRDTPEWANEVLAELDARAAERSTRPPREDFRGDRGERPQGRREDRGERGEGRGGGRPNESANWENLRNNPDEWYDNRTRKTNPRAPDFVRKDDRNTAIWLDSRGTPEWANEVLAEIDSRRQQRGAERRAQREAERDPAQEAAAWDALRADPGAWYDNRNNKTGPGSPDFRNRQDRTMVLYLDSANAPAWLNEFLVERDAAYAQSAPDREARRQAELVNWEALRADPGAWFDNRNNKTNPKQPDFRNRDDRQRALWLSSRDKPSWVDQWLAEVDGVASPAGVY